MIVRKRLDISWRGLARAAARGLFGGDERAALRSVQATFGEETSAWPCLSVRTGFDATLTALDLPRGSEVLVSAITIPGMLRILEAHGLVPIPVDIDVASSGVSLDSAERALTPRTRVILAAPLFGARNDDRELCRWARSRNLVVFADEAQAFAGPAASRRPAADVTMLSFGPIKTATTLSGAVFLFRDPALRAKVEAATSDYEAQSNRAYFARTLRFGAVKVLGYGPVASVAAAIVAAVGKDPDRVTTEIAQSFPGADFLDRIRRRPASGLLATLAERLANFDDARFARRQAAGEFLRERLGPSFVVPGATADRMTYWTFPLLVADPDATVWALRRLGYDATRRSSLVVVDAPPGRDPTATDRTRAWFDRMIFLPFDVEMSERVLSRLAADVRRRAERFVPPRMDDERAIARPSVAGEAFSSA